jgi:hypothetical protein
MYLRFFMYLLVYQRIALLACGRAKPTEVYEWKAKILGVAETWSIIDAVFNEQQSLTRV